MTNRNIAILGHDQREPVAVGMLATLVCLLALQSCGKSNKVATECYHLQEAINAHQPSLSGPINKASETAKAQAQQGLVEALTAVELSDAELQGRRDKMVSFNQQLHTLSLQAAEVMTDNGYLSGDASNQYEAITAQRIAVYDQLSTERSSLQIHCSLQ